MQNIPAKLSKTIVFLLAICFSNTSYGNGYSGISRSLADATLHPVAIFILQLVIIIIAAQTCGFLFKKAGQPAVMGEIVAGILLGPSALGTLFPSFTSFIFPLSSLSNLHMLSQVGLILFMFVIGMELDFNIIKKKARAAILISNAGIIVPYMLGVGLSFWLYYDFAPANIPFYAFALFIGIAMSITAFPVLARIIKERGLTNTRMGSIAIVSAATNDVAGWCILAIVIAVVKAGTPGNSLFTLIAAVIYTGAMLWVVRPLLKNLSRLKTGDELIKRSSIAIIFIMLLVSSYCSEIIGIHALFGAFMAGVVMPIEWDFRKLIIAKIEDVSMVMLLPLFFVFTGLRTNITLLNEPYLWIACLAITLTAIVGKFAGSAIAARIAGENMHDSLAIGTLMNTRGLMELIVLNIGYDLGILSPEVFAMLVIMALVTTFMTSPVLNLLDKYYLNKADLH